jgi:hypothetical protein
MEPEPQQCGLSSYGYCAIDQAN